MAQDRLLQGRRGAFPCCDLQTGILVTSVDEIKDFLPKKVSEINQMLFINCKSGTPVLQFAMATVPPVFGRICATFHMCSWILAAAGNTVLPLVAVGQGCLVLAVLPKACSWRGFSSEVDMGTCPFCWAGTDSILLALLLHPRGESLL